MKESPRSSSPNCKVIRRRRRCLKATRPVRAPFFEALVNLLEKFGGENCMEFGRLSGIFGDASFDGAFDLSLPPRNPKKNCIKIEAGVSLKQNSSIAVCVASRSCVMACFPFKLLLNGRDDPMAGAALDLGSGILCLDFED